MKREFFEPEIIVIEFSVENLMADEKGDSQFGDNETPWEDENIN